MSDSNGSFQRSISSSYATGSNEKYGGLLKVPLRKRVQNLLVNLFSYVYSVAPTFVIVHNIISVLRILQLIGPSFFASYDILWIKGSKDLKMINIISVLFQIIPVTYNDESFEIFLIIYIIIQALVIIFIFSAAYYFEKNANLPPSAYSFISFYFASFAHILHPIAINISVTAIFNMVTGKRDVTASSICIIIFSFLLSLFITFITMRISSRSLTFRPNSFLTVSMATWNFQYNEVNLITILSSIGAPFGDKHRWVCILMISLTGIIYALSLYLPFFQGGFVQNIIENSLLATNIACFVNCILMLVFVILDKPAKNYLIFIYIFIWLIFLLLSRIITSRYKIKALNIMDEINDGRKIFEAKIKSANQCINYMKVGFESAHPICLSWSFCKSAVENWPKNQYIWFAFAKFAAIYPEETQKLEWIYVTVKQSKIHGSTIQTIKEQSLSITRQRETALSSELKTKITKLSKDVNSTKHKLRHVWDSVLQGNISEVEDATKRVSIAIRHNSIDFNRLLRQFPNNRFVTRPYGRFLAEIVGDLVKSAEVIEKTSLLQRGISVNADQTHVFGTKAFPNLPQHPMNSPITNDANMNSTSVSEVEIDEANTNITDNVVLLKDIIERVKIPAVRNSFILMFVVIFLIFILPFIVILVVVSNFTNSLKQPLDHMENLALIDTFATNLVAFSHHWIYKCLKVFEEIKYYGRDPPSSLGGFNLTSGQLHHSISQLSEKIQTINEFRNFKPHDSIVQKAQYNLFSNSINYTFFFTEVNTSSDFISAQSALVDFVMQISSIVGYDSAIVPVIINTSCPLNLYYNLQNVRTKITDSFAIIVDYITSQQSYYKKVTLWCEVGVIIFIAIVYLISLIITNKWIIQNKEVVYNCLTSLPKSTVSQLAESLRILQKDTNSVTGQTTDSNAELSKQEDNILKIFNTGGRAENKLGDLFFLGFIAIIIFVLELICVVLLCQLVNREIDILLQHAPQIIYVLEQYTTLMNTVNSLSMLAVQDSYVPIPIFTRKELLDQIDHLIERATHYYTNVRYGTDKLQPYDGYQDGVNYSIEKSLCDENKMNNLDLGTISTSFRENVECSNADVVYTSLIGFIQYSMVNRTGNVPDGQIDPSNQILSDIWFLTVCRIYDEFIYPMHFNIKVSILSSMKSTKNEIYSIIIVLMIVAVLFQVISYLRIWKINNHIKFVLSLLLHCNADQIIQSPKIMAVLSGEFSTVKSNTAVRTASFFNTVLNSLPEVIMVVNQDNNIESVNKQCCSLFSCEPKDLIGTPVASILLKFDGDSTKLLSAPSNNIILKFKKKSKNASIPNNGANTTPNVKDENGSGSSLELSNFIGCSLMSNNKLAIILRDNTTAVRYNNLIQQEKTKSDEMLAAILPHSLVPRVQAGEKDISFSIQSATIVFMDIVSFTPWCGSLPADKVMATLNLLFKKFDRDCNRYSTMTKIKCIGDCYMASGGVFAEVNQPTEHAKDVVNFGLDSLKSVTELNSELNETLQIRVGVNTGGPIVAGVIGVGKPTFEILGPAINMAQQMEHHGVAMQVHITRSVYELVYGDMFIIKERGLTEVKGGSVLTYLVSGRK
ncbi:hypothetical protein M9Y10_011457 [Tritrichomonas musculus]|uniref:Adenylate and Guanylate cyclase catalytic domain containing protein n=1 Tax=Tritrichomonas musculus TaxID=1915356 RepID=A0ABR2IJI1_9EUKA